MLNTCQTYTVFSKMQEKWPALKTGQTPRESQQHKMREGGQAHGKPNEGTDNQRPQQAKQNEEQKLKGNNRLTQQELAEEVAEMIRSLDNEGDLMNIR